jgi:hypothetical protein
MQHAECVVSGRSCPAIRGAFLGRLARDTHPCVVPSNPLPPLCRSATPGRLAAFDEELFRGAGGPGGAEAGAGGADVVPLVAALSFAAASAAEGQPVAVGRGEGRGGEGDHCRPPLAPIMKERKKERKTYARLQACVKGARNQ